VYTYMCAYIYICVCVYIHVYICVCIHIHMYEDSIMKPTKYCLKRGGERKEGYGNVIEAVNLFKVHCMHLRNYHHTLYY
jgi:hypothetical protein